LRRADGALTNMVNVAVMCVLMCVLMCMVRCKVLCMVARRVHWGAVVGAGMFGARRGMVVFLLT